MQERKTLAYYDQKITLEQLRLAFKSNPAPYEIVLKDVPLTPEMMDLLSAHLKINDNVAKLRLGNNGLYGNDIALLAAALKQNKTLRVLSLNSNDLGDEGVMLLMNAINANKYSNLRELELKFNAIKSSGYLAIADMLSSNDKISSILLEGNEISGNFVVISKINHELSTNTREESQREKHEALFVEEGYVKSLKSLLSTESFKYETGVHEGLDKMRACLDDPTIPIMCVWPKLMEIVIKRDGFFQRNRPRFVGGRDEITITIYKAVLNKSVDIIQQLENEYLRKDEGIGYSPSILIDAHVEAKAWKNVSDTINNRR